MPASRSALAPAHEADLTAWDRMVDTNIKGLMHMTRAVLPGMVARDRGHIVNIGSVSATNPYRGGNVYASSKAFVRQFSLNLRADLQGTSVRVTDVSPGFSSGSEFSAVRFGDEARAAKLYEGADPLHPDDIADAVCWVVSRPARVNVNVLEVMPVCQSSSPLTIIRK